MNVNVQSDHRWNDTDRKTEVQGERHALLPLHPVKYQVDWSGIDPGYPKSGGEQTTLADVKVLS